MGYQNIFKSSIYMGHIFNRIPISDWVWCSLFFVLLFIFVCLFYGIHLVFIQFAHKSWCLELTNRELGKKKRASGVWIDAVADEFDFRGGRILLATDFNGIRGKIWLSKHRPCYEVLAWVSKIFKRFSEVESSSFQLTPFCLYYYNNGRVFDLIEVDN